MLITVWPALNANQGTRVDVPWPTLGDFVAALPDGYLFSCATFAGDCRERNKTSELFEQATAVVLDHDAAAVPFASACDQLKQSRALAYETKTAGRWRAILPLAQPITGYTDYKELTKPLTEKMQCAPESGTGAQLWYPPRKGFRYLSPFDGETRLIAWITGDFDNPLIADAPIRDHDGSVDRSRLDMMIAIRLQEIGVTREEAQAIFAARGDLSHSASDYHVDLLWKKATARRDAIARTGMVFAGGLVAAEAPTVVLGADVFRVADECIAGLAQDDKLFTRDATITELIGKRTRQLSAPSILDRLSKRVLLVTRDPEEGDKRIMPPKWLAEVVRDRGEYPSMRALKGVSEVPILRPDGSITEEEGYDKATGFYRLPGLKIDTAGKDAKQALQALREPFSEFPWVDPAMIDIPIALICAVACRTAVQGNVPLFVLDASKAGSGKSLLANTASIIATGQPGGGLNFPASDEEMAKTLAGLARQSLPLISLDNVTRVISGDALDSALTCEGLVHFRILGQSKIETRDWYSVLCVNGNQLRVGGDTRRRVVVARIAPSKKLASYKHELPRYAYEHRSELLSAAITLVRSGIINGVPKLDRRPSFDTFVRVIAGAIVAAGGHDITQFWNEEETITDSDEAREAMAAWIAVRWPNGASASLIADDLGENFMASAEATALLNSYGLTTHVKDALRFIAEAHPKASKRQAMAWALFSWRDIVGTNGFKITGGAGKGAIWRATYCG